MTKKEIDDNKIKDFIKYYEIAMKKFIDWGYREKMDLFLYRKIIYMIGKCSENIEELLNEETYDKFIALTYLTLISWNMDQRKAHLEFFDTYRKNILDNSERFKEFKGISLEKIEESELPRIKAKLKTLFNNLNLMISKGRIVSNSKVLHFFLPDLMMPIDRNTLNYLRQRDSVEGFLNIFEFMWKVANQIDLSKFVDNLKWNTTIPKVIDNIILSIERERGRKKYYNKKLKEFKKDIKAGKQNKEKYRKGENKYQTITPDILDEIIEDIKEGGNQYFNGILKEIID